MFRTALVAVAMLGLSATTVQATFDNVMVSPRTRAMGDAGVAVPTVGFAAYLNPAALGLATHSEVNTSYVQPYGLDFFKLVYAGGAYHLGQKYGTLGVGLRSFGVDYKNVDLMKEATYTLSHGIGLYEDLHSAIALGYSLNLYRLEFGKTTEDEELGSDTVPGVDLGLLVTLHERTRLGVLVKNLNNPTIGVDAEEIPQRLHAGISYEPYLGVITTFEFENVLGEDLQYHGGIEMHVADGLYLRAGTITNPSKLTAGFGYTTQGFTVNYGFSTGGGTLANTHQFGLNYAWGGEAE